MKPRYETPRDRTNVPAIIEGAAAILAVIITSIVFYLIFL